MAIAAAIAAEEEELHAHEPHGKLATSMTRSEAAEAEDEVDESALVALADSFQYCFDSLSILTFHHLQSLISSSHYVRKLHCIQIAVFRPLTHSSCFDVSTNLNITGFSISPRGLFLLLTALLRGSLRA